MDNNFKIITKSAKETEKLGEKLANELILKQVQDDDGAKIISLYGELGSGKTTFVHGVARGLGVNGRIMSPTFVFIRFYHLSSINHDFYHVDLYRCQSLNDVKVLGLEEIIAGKNNIVLIEWPEIIKSILPKKRIEISFKYLDENKREIRILDKPE